MKKKIISFVLSVLAFSPSWSSDSELEEEKGSVGVFNDQFELEEEVDKDGSPYASPESKKISAEKDIYTPSAPIFIRTPQREEIEHSESLPTDLDFVVGSFKAPSLFPCSYNSYLEEEKRKKIMNKMNKRFKKRNETVNAQTLEEPQKLEGDESD